MEAAKQASRQGHVTGVSSHVRRYFSKNTAACSVCFGLPHRNAAFGRSLADPMFTWSSFVQCWTWPKQCWCLYLADRTYCTFTHKCTVILPLGIRTCYGGHSMLLTTLQFSYEQRSCRQDLPVPVHAWTRPGTGGKGVIAGQEGVAGRGSDMTGRGRKSQTESGGHEENSNEWGCGWRERQGGSTRLEFWGGRPI